MPTYIRSPWQGMHQSTGNTKAADTLRQPHSFFNLQDSTDPYDLKTRSNRMHTVCFTGHRSLASSDDAVSQLPTLLELLYRQGYRDFLCGGALGFDQIAAEHVIHLRCSHPDVRLIFCLPCADQSARWHSRDCQRYEQLLYMSDEIRVLSPRYYNGCMQTRNRYMVDRSNLCIACMKRLHGGTLATVRYAISEDVPVLNIAVPSALKEYIQSL